MCCGAQVGINQDPKYATPSLRLLYQSAKLIGQHRSSHRKVEACSSQRELQCALSESCQPCANDSMIPILTNVQFSGLSLDKHHGPVFSFTADAPPGQARNPNSGSRYAFWKFGKRMMSGGMVALVSKRGDAAPVVRVGVVSQGTSSGG